MDKFKGVLFVTDLDGTLLRDDKTVSKKNIDAIKYFQSEGGIFTFVTGRIPEGARPVYNQVKPNAPCGCINGGGIYDFRTNELIWSVNISKDVLELVEHIDKEVSDMGIEINCYDKIYFCKVNEATEKHRNDEGFELLACNYNDVQEEFSKILFCDFNMDNMNKTIDLLKKHPKSYKFDFIRSDRFYYEILPKGSSKANLVKKLIEILGIEKEKTIAVGDNDNDVSMIESVNIGIAVANASYKAKKAANFHTVSNEDDAIAKIIEELDKGIIKI